MSKDSYDPDVEQEGEEDRAAQLMAEFSNEELAQKLVEAEQKSTENWERVLRMQAEAENASRRAERDVTSAHKFALEKFVNELLPIVDALELCESSVPDDMRKAAKSVIEGVDMTLKLFYNALEKFGIQQVNPVGETFNPETQQAISMQEDTAVKPGMVISVLQKGYTLNNRLVRPALVVVAK
tara:strand:- start:2733 stop:3281 length:549 start_codon:yes stop_codon:yes gene_type:complete